MGVPNTGGQLRTSIADMQVGDYIQCRYDWDNTNGARFCLNDDTKTESPTSGVSSPTYPGQYIFYFIMVEKSESGYLLVADRVVHNTVSWDTLNGKDLIQGKKYELPDWKISLKIPGIIRSLNGGVAYADANGNPVTTDQGLGAAPVTNEWDRYIVRKDYGTGASRDDVWHFNTATLTTDTKINDSTARMYRGIQLASNVGFIVSNYSHASYGYRPVFQYQEVTN